tara:strand:+ start:186 stop:428 length:243 start_codon:yes stop_codon:yes gene_type:complete
MFAEHADSEILMPQMNTQIFGITAQRVYISQQRKTHAKSKISNYARSKRNESGKRKLIIKVKLHALLRWRVLQGNASHLF